LISSRALQPVERLFAPLTKRLLGLDGSFGFVYVSSSLSGYPIGAKITCDLKKEGIISENQAERFALFSSVTGPAFMSVICISILKVPEAFIHILISHNFSMILIIALYTLIYKKENCLKGVIKRSGTERGLEYSKLLTESLISSFKTLAVIFELVIVFFVIAAIITQIGLLEKIYYLFSDIPMERTPIKPLSYGILEMTAGCITTGESSLPFDIKASLCAGLLGFGGLSIFSQTKSILSSQKIKAKGLFIIKLFHGILSYILCSLMLKLFPIQIKTAATPVTADNFKFLYLYIPVLLFLYLIIYLKKKMT